MSRVQQWGRKAIDLEPGGSPNNLSKRVIEVEFPDGQRIFNVNLGAPEGSLVPTINTFIPKARARWGSSGTQCEADVDIISGTSFHVIGSFLTVDVWNDVDSGGDTVTVDAACAVGSVPHQTRVTNTIRDQVAPVTFIAQSAVPHFGKRVIVHREAIAAVMTLVMRDRLGNIIMSGVFAAGTAMLNSIDLPGDCAIVACTLPASAGTNVRFVYGLSL